MKLKGSTSTQLGGWQILCPLNVSQCIQCPSLNLIGLIIAHPWCSSYSICISWWVQPKPRNRPESHQRTIDSSGSSSQWWSSVRGKQYHPRPPRGRYGTFIPLCCRWKNSSPVAQRRDVTKREWISPLMLQRTKEKNAYRYI